MAMHKCCHNVFLQIIKKKRFANWRQRRVCRFYIQSVSLLLLTSSQFRVLTQPTLRRRRKKLLSFVAGILLHERKFRRPNEGEGGWNNVNIMNIVGGGSEWMCEILYKHTFLRNGYVTVSPFWRANGNNSLQITVVNVILVVQVLKV